MNVLSRELVHWSSGRGLEFGGLRRSCVVGHELSGSATLVEESRRNPVVSPPVVPPVSLKRTITSNEADHLVPCWIVSFETIVKAGAIIPH